MQKPWRDRKRNPANMDNKNARKIFQFIHEHPGKSRSEIKRGTGIWKTGCERIPQQLTALGVVIEDRTTYPMKYYPAPAKAKVNPINENNEDFLESIRLNNPGWDIDWVTIRMRPRGN